MTNVALALGIYATLLSTLVALVTLYGELFARIDVIAQEAYLVPRTSGAPLIVRGDDALQALGAQDSARSEIVSIAIRNRGRRPAQILQVSVPGTHGFHVIDDLFERFPLVVEPGTTRTLTLGDQAPYRHGELNVARFFVSDGAGRIHPLRERWRQAPARLVRRARRRLRR